MLILMSILLMSILLLFLKLMSGLMMCGVGHHRGGQQLFQVFGRGVDESQRCMEENFKARSSFSR